MFPLLLKIKAFSLQDSQEKSNKTIPATDLCHRTNNLDNTRDILSTEHGVLEIPLDRRGFPRVTEDRR